MADSASSAPSPRRRPCDLYPNFVSAATVLRTAWIRGEIMKLKGEDEDKGEKREQQLLLEQFFDLLDAIEIEQQQQHDDETTSSCWSFSDDHFVQQQQQQAPQRQQTPFLIAIEGLDGTGKSTLVKNLVSSLQSSSTSSSLILNDSDDGSISASAWSTPSSLIKDARSIFDKCGGGIARAYYTISNYVLYYEILSFQQKERMVCVIDRFWSSTCAYTVGWNNKNDDSSNNNDDDSIDKLPESWFRWPGDLVRPNLVLILTLDDEVRQERVSSRLALASKQQLDPNNPWDSRLQKDRMLGQRIMQSLKRVHDGPLETVCVSANGTPDEVLQSALSIVKPRIARHFASASEYYKYRPLEWFQYTSMCLGYCDMQESTSGASISRRRYHQPWAMQLALSSSSSHPSSSSSSSPPYLRTVGIHTVDSGGFVYFYRGGRDDGCDEKPDVPTAASMVWVGGSYPHEQQWRAEGFIYEMTAQECRVLNMLPPPSLVSQIATCIKVEKEDQQHQQQQRSDRPASYTGMVKQFRQGGDDALLRNEFDLYNVQGARFVPLRMEVLMGGPSSPDDGPVRLEWTRQYHHQQQAKQQLGDDEKEGTAKNNTGSGWSCARSVLPFGRPSASLVRHLGILLPVTLVLTGTHCSGKATLGKRIADVLKWDFQPELGEILRPNRDPDGHRDGYTKDWDDHVFAEERKRDERQELKMADPACRVVETWHVGNLAWALYRLGRQEKEKGDNAGGNATATRAELMKKARSAIQLHARNTLIVFAHLSISPDTSAQRRNKDNANRDRLPLSDKASECLDSSGSGGNSDRKPTKEEVEESLCLELYEALDVKGLELLRDIVDKDNGIPNSTMVVVDNSQDGEDAIEEAVRVILGHIHENLWRRIPPH